MNKNIKISKGSRGQDIIEFGKNVDFEEVIKFFKNYEFVNDTEAVIYEDENSPYGAYLLWDKENGLMFSDGRMTQGIEIDELEELLDEVDLYITELN